VSPGRWATVALAVAAAAGCTTTLDAGRDLPHGPLPVDERNPVLILNDSCTDNWVGEYALLLAATGGPPLVGVVVNASSYWPTLSRNLSGWTDLMTAATDSGLRDVPEVVESNSPTLIRPADGKILSTVANRSAGAKFIVDTSLRVSLPWRRMVVVAGEQLTELADAYLMDQTVVNRVVVVAALGSVAAGKAVMTAPNGELDTWSDSIVAQVYDYVQVSAFYDQTGDVTTAQLANLPQNALGAYMAAKQPNLLSLQVAADQVGVLSLAIPTFATTVERMAPDLGAPPSAVQGPPFVANPTGNVWAVTQVAAPLAGGRLWTMLLGKNTFSR
jgi:hypothetical protein